MGGNFSIIIAIVRLFFNSYIGVGKIQLSMLRSYSWLCWYGVGTLYLTMMGIKHLSVVCKASNLFSVLSLQPKTIISSFFLYREKNDALVYY